MKGLILSGGTGSRLRPLTYTSAKQLIPVANKPILYYAIEALKEAGVVDIGIIVGETKEEVRAGVGDGSRWGVRITYIEQEAPLGLAHAVKIAEPFIQKDPFIMFLGDNLVREGVVQFVRKFEENKPNSLILLSEVEEPQRFGVAELSNDDGVIITNSEIEFSIVLEDSRIEDIPARVDRSLIGKNVTVRKGITRPKANSFVVGDNSIISIM
ncbi:MAG: sugar phosphate nucleotidyltransferase [Thermincolia bacterium]